MCCRELHRWLAQKLLQLGADPSAGSHGQTAISPISGTGMDFMGGAKASIARLLLQEEGVDCLQRNGSGPSSWLAYFCCPPHRPNQLGRHAAGPPGAAAR